MQDVLALTIDVECDSDGGPTWRYSSPLGFRNVEHGMGEVLARTLDEANANATLLVSNVVMGHPPSVQLLRELSRVELGAHLHGDFLPPELRAHDPSGEKTVENQCEYSDDMEWAKLNAVTTMFTEAFGRRPTAFRAGRWSAGGRTALFLSRLGYLADSSVTPHVRWTDGGRDVDYTGAPDQPYRPDPASISLPGELPLWEFPVSIIRPWWAAGRAIWLRPSLSPTAAMWKIVTTMRSQHPAPRTFVAMLHSSELTAGASPYSRDERGAARVAARLSGLLHKAREAGLRFATLSELASERQRGD
jgi:hypothetical protein